MACTACGSPLHERLDCPTLPACHICATRMGSNLLCNTCHHHFCWADWEGHGCPEAAPDLPPEDDPPPMPHGIDVEVVLTLKQVAKGTRKLVAIAVPRCEVVSLRFDVRFARGLYGRVMKGCKLPVLELEQTLELRKLLLRLPEDCEYLIRKWCTALAIRQRFLQFGVLEERGRELCSELVLAKAKAEHDLTHYGEIPHTLRHWLRGGNVILDCKALVPFKWKDGMTSQWFEQLELMKLAAPGCIQNVTLCDPLRYDDTSLTKINHTDLQYYQVSFSPEQFFVDLQNEFSFPDLISLTPGYDEVLKEVTTTWKKAYGGGPVGVVMWVRFVAGGAINGNDNRPIHPYELQGCLQAAKELAAKLKCKRVLVLGDERSLERFSEDGKYRIGEEDIPVMLGAHMNVKDVRRSQLQQLQFLTAIVRVTGAQIVLGERSGSVDKLSLCGGIPCCQFVAARVRQGNERLDEVFALGCGMGFKVDLASCGGVPAVKSTIVEAALIALQHWKDLRAALLCWERFRREGL